MKHEATVESLAKVFDEWTKPLNSDIGKFWTCFDADSETVKGAGKGLSEFFQWISVT